MIRALSIVNEVLLSKQWPLVSTIESAALDLNTKKALQAVNYTGTVLGRFIFWRFLHGRGEVKTIAEYTDGTVQLSNNSKTVVGALTNWTPDFVGRAFKATAFEEIYRIEEVVNPELLRLSQEFLGLAKALAAYAIAQDRYELPEDFDSELAFLHYKGPENIDLLSPERFDELRFGPMAHGPGFGMGGTSTLVTDDPRFGTIEVDSNGRQYIVFDPYPKNRITVPFSYYKALLPLARDEDLWPFPYYVRPVIHDGALHYLEQNAAGDIQKGQVSLQEFFNSRSELTGLHRRTDAFGRIEPDTGLRRRMSRKRVSTVGYDLGTLFDRY